MLFQVFAKKESTFHQHWVDEAIEKSEKIASDIFAKQDAFGDIDIDKFNIISLFICCKVWQLRTSGFDEKATALQQEFYDRLEVSLREKGGSDIKVGPKVRKLASFYSGQLKAYSEALCSSDETSFCDAVLRNTLLDSVSAKKIFSQTCLEIISIKAG